MTHICASMHLIAAQISINLSPPQRGMETWVTGIRWGGGAIVTVRTDADGLEALGRFSPN